MFFNQNMFVYATFFLVIAIHLGLFYTRWGLRSRSVGEHPKAADTVGIDVFKTRYRNVILGGCIAGFGGAFLTLSQVSRFEENLTAGIGFIGLAAMIFGRWMPLGALGAGLVFGFARALQQKLGHSRYTHSVGVPVDAPVHRHDHRRRRCGWRRPATRGRRAALHQAVAALTISRSSAWPDGSRKNERSG